MIFLPVCLVQTSTSQKFICPVPFSGCWMIRYLEGGEPGAHSTDALKDPGTGPG